MADQSTDLFSVSDITLWIPSLQNADSLVQKLKEIGVEMKDDLRYVTEQDLLPMVKPIQARKLISAWSHLISTPKIQAQSSTPIVDPTSEIMSTTPSTITSPLSTSSQSPFQIPWHKMPRDLMLALSNKVRPTPSLRRDMIRIICSDISSIHSHPGRRQLRQLAEKIVCDYPSSFRDLVEGDVVGSGHESLLLQLEARLENISRGNVKRKLSDGDTGSSAESGSRKTTCSRAPLSTSFQSPFQIPWHKMPHDLMLAVSNKLRPTPSLRRQMIRIICSDIDSIYSHPGRSQLRQLAEKIVCDYPSSFLDLVGGDVIGSGHDSLLLQLEARLDNTNRRRHSVKRELSDGSAGKSGSRKTICPRAPLSMASKSPCQIPWHKMPHDLMLALSNKERPTPSLRREMIRIICSDIGSIHSHPGRRQLRQLAEKIVCDYPSSFRDLVDGDVVGSGHESLLLQLEARLDHINRRKRSVKRKLSDGNAGSSAESESRKTACLRDYYGCVNWQPVLLPENVVSDLKFKQAVMFDLSCVQNHDMDVVAGLLKETYCLQRADINSGMNAAELLKSWPLLFTVEGINIHFEQLTNITLLETMKAAFDRKTATLIDFLNTSKKCDPVMKRLAEAKFELSNESPTVIGLLLALAAYFGENEESLIITKDFGTDEQDITIDAPATPCLIVLGSSALTGKSFLIAVNKVVVLRNIQSPLVAVTILFGLFYVLNLHYPNGFTISLEFLQRLETSTMSVAKPEDNLFHKVFVNINGVTKSVFVPAKPPDDEPSSDQISTSIDSSSLPPQSAIVIRTSSSPTRIPFIIIPSNRPPFTSIAVVPPLNSNRAPSSMRAEPPQLIQAEHSGGSFLPPRTVPKILQNRHQLQSTNIISTRLPVPAPRVIVIDKSGNGNKPRFTLPAGAVLRAFIRPTITMSSTPVPGQRFYINSSMSTVPSFGNRPTMSVCRPTFSIRPLMVCPNTSAITNPRTLTKDEAVAVGWHDGITIGDTESSAINCDPSYENPGVEHIASSGGDPDQLSNVIVEKACAAVEPLTASDDLERISRDVVDEVGESNIDSLEVIKSRPNFEDKSPCVQRMIKPSITIKSESRPSSAFSDETMYASESEHLMRVQDDEARLQKLSALTGRLQGASRRKQDLRKSVFSNKIVADEINNELVVALPKARRRSRQRGARKRGHKVAAKRQGPNAVATIDGTFRSVLHTGTGTVQKARRTGGRPMSASERFKLIDCIVWAERVVLPPGKVSINRHAVRLYSCCDVNYLSAQPSRRVANLQKILSDSRVNVLAHKTSTVLQSIFRRLTDLNTARTTKSLALKAAKMTPISNEGTPILLHRLDGNRKTSAVVMARPATEKSQLKNKFLLIRTNNGSFLVPADDGGTGRTASTVAELLKSHRELMLKSGDADAKTIDSSNLQQSSMVKEEDCKTENASSMCVVDQLSSVTSMDSRNVEEDSNPEGNALCKLNPSGTLTISRKALVMKRRKKGKKSRGAKQKPRFVPAETVAKEIKGAGFPTDPHRERIEELKERLRLQQEQLDKIRKQKNSTSVAE